MCCCCCAKIEGKLTKCGNLCITRGCAILFSFCLEFFFFRWLDHIPYGYGCLWCICFDAVVRAYSIHKQASKLNSFTRQSILFQPFLHLLSTSAGAVDVCCCYQRWFIAIFSLYFSFYSIICTMSHNIPISIGFYAFRQISIDILCFMCLYVYMALKLKCLL